MALWVSVHFLNPAARLQGNYQIRTFRLRGSCKLSKISPSENGGATSLVAVIFSALPGGNRNNNNGTFNNVGNNGNWWSSTENDATNAWNRNMNYDNGNVNRNNNNKRNGFSVRCVRVLKCAWFYK